MRARGLRLGPLRCTVPKGTNAARVRRLSCRAQAVSALIAYLQDLGVAGYGVFAVLMIFLQVWWMSRQPVFGAKYS